MSTKFNQIENGNILKVNFRNERYNYQGYVDIWSITDHTGRICCRFKDHGITKIDPDQNYGVKMGFMDEELYIDMEYCARILIREEPTVANAIADFLKIKGSLKPISTDDRTNYLRYSYDNKSNSCWGEGPLADWRFSSILAAMKVESEKHFAFVDRWYG